MLWVAYTDNPQWRDVMWYYYHMWNRGDHYEGSIHGKVPDAPVVERDPEFGYLPRHWKPSP